MSERGPTFVTLDIYEAATVAHLLRVHQTRLRGATLSHHPVRAVNAVVLLDNTEALLTRIERRFRSKHAALGRMLGIETDAR